MAGIPFWNEWGFEWEVVGYSDPPQSPLKGGGGILAGGFGSWQRVVTMQLLMCDGYYGFC